MKTANDHDNVFFMSRRQGVSFDRVRGIGGRAPTQADHQRTESMLERLGGRRLAYDSGVSVPPLQARAASCGD